MPAFPRMQIAENAEFLPGTVLIGRRANCKVPVRRLALHRQA